MRKVTETPSLPQPATRNPLELYRAFAAYLTRFLGDFGYRLNRVIANDGTDAMAAPLPLATYTMATLPAAASWTGAIIYVSDGAVGAKFQGSNGAAWVALG